MLMLRIRACHMHGSFVAKDKVARGSGFRTRSRIRNDRRRESSAAPARTHRNRRGDHSMARRRAVIRREPAERDACGDLDGIGIVMQGGLTTRWLRSLEMMGLAASLEVADSPVRAQRHLSLVPDEFVESLRASGHC